MCVSVSKSCLTPPPAQLHQSKKCQEKGGFKANHFQFKAKLGNLQEKFQKYLQSISFERKRQGQNKLSVILRVRKGNKIFFGLR